MGSLQRANFQKGVTTDDPLDIAAITINSTELSTLPVVTSALDKMTIVLDPLEVNGAPEIVEVTSHVDSATAATIVRGADGTTPREHPVGTTWVHAVVASDFDSIRNNKTLYSLENRSGGAADFFNVTNTSMRSTLLNFYEKFDRLDHSRTVEATPDSSRLTVTGTGMMRIDCTVEMVPNAPGSRDMEDLDPQSQVTVYVDRNGTPYRGISAKLAPMGDTGSLAFQDMVRASVSGLILLDEDPTSATFELRVEVAAKSQGTGSGSAFGDYLVSGHLLIEDM